MYSGIAMPMPSFVKVCLSVVMLATPSLATDGSQLTLESGQTLTCRSSTKVTVCSIGAGASGGSSFSLEQDKDIRPGSAVSLKLIGQTDHAIVFVDSYPSRPGGLQLCQAGRESFLRVVSTATRRPTETFHTKLESCHENHQLALDGLLWDAGSRSLRVHWLQSPRDGKEAKETLHIDAAGAVHEQPGSSVVQGGENGRP